MANFTESKSRIVLGGGSFYQMNTMDLSKILSLAVDLNIDKIDTAPTYGKSEQLIGDVASHYGQFQLSTKVWHKNPSDMDEKYIFASLQNSLKNLKVDFVECVYLHSLNPKLIKNRTYIALSKLKKEGLVKNIGVSSDNESLQFFYSLGIFDSFMSTLNLIDQKNLSVLKNISQNKKCKVVTKRSLANGVWRRDLVGKYIRIYDLTFNRSTIQDKNSYQSRHKLLSSLWGASLSRTDYFKFAFLWNKNCNVVIGTRKLAHLKFCRDQELFYSESNDQINEFVSLWNTSNIVSDCIV